MRCSTVAEQVPIITITCLEKGDDVGKLLVLPRSFEELKQIGVKIYGAPFVKVLNEQGVEIDDIHVVRDGDRIIYATQELAEEWNASVSITTTCLENGDAQLPVRAPFVLTTFCARFMRVSYGIVCCLLDVVCFLLYIVWEASLVIMCIYSAWAAPFELAFLDRPMMSISILDNVINALFAIDIILTWNWNYANSWFAFDVISTIPSELVWYISPIPLKQYAYALCNLLRLWRLRRVFALFAR